MSRALWRLAAGVSLRYKIMGIGLAVIVLLGPGLTWQVRELMARSLTHELEQRAVSIARNLATRSTDLILTNNLYGLYALTQDIVSTDEDVRYAFVVSPEGHVLAHSFDQGFPADLLEASVVTREEQYKRQLILTEEGFIEDVALPIFNGRAGVARVGLSHQRLEDTLQSATRQILLSLAVASLLGVGISVLSSWLLARPVRDLAEGTRLVAQGHLSHRLSPWARDEIGQLQASFNAMAEELQRKEELRRQLLRKIITVQEEERRRIARELHDEAGQALTSLLLGLSVIDQAASLSQARAVSSNLKEVVGETLDALHNLALELRPSVLDDLGLVPALQRYVESCPTRLGLQADLVTAGTDEMRLPPEVETTFYRIAQEALTNVARHALASEASVLLERRQRSVVLVIEDNGVGFDVAQVMDARQQRERLGLYGMEERASLAGCRLTVESRPGAGTTITVEFPLEEV